MSNTAKSEILVDGEDVELLLRYVWKINAHGYVYRTYDSKTLHRVLMGEPEGLVDHANGNKLDNRRSNLRLATKSQNAANAKKRKSKNQASPYKGVSRAPRGGKRCPWRARIALNYREISLGYFETEIEAARAYDKAAREHYGEFARLNFPGEK